MLPGLVRIDEATRAAYASDASIYRRVPVAVVEPCSAADVAMVVRAAAAAGVPVTARGGGTSVAGNAIGRGVVLDFSRRMDKIIEIDAHARTARVQPGVVLDNLRAAASEHGLTFGPDPSTHSRCTIGGMIGNNACGSHSVAWGTTADNVVELRMVRADGSEVTVTGSSSGDPGVDEQLRALVGDNLALLRTELGRFGRQVSGYGLHYLLPERGFDVAKALVGSESTCGVITEATVRLVDPPAARALLVLGFPDVYLAAEVAPQLASAGAMTVEGMAADLLAALRSRPGKANAGDALPVGQAWLYCEAGGVSLADAMARAHDLARIAQRGGAVTSLVVTDEMESRALWRIREAGAGIVTRLADGGEAWPGWEDSAVPPRNLAAYLRDLYALLDAHGLRGVPFGHFGEGCVHLRLDFELGSRGGLARYRSFVAEAAELVAAHGGSVSGEHGDGRARSELLEAMYSKPMLDCFAAFKHIFDPQGTLNPDVLVDPAPLDADVRPGPLSRALEVTPVHALHRDRGSFAAAVNRCVGVGACRSLDSGSMCPSFKATRDEVHSTRGRARVLAEMLRGESILDGWRAAEVRDALDLCLSCKACANDCPVNVDMATYKAEFQHHHYAGRMRPLAHYSMGWLPLWAKLVASVPGLAPTANALLSKRPVAALVKRLGGIEQRREMIRFAPRSLSRWMRRRTSRGARTVVLWPDTFTNFLSPDVGRAAVEVLEALGYRVVLPDGFVCCGLTWHSTGQLSSARRVLARSLDALGPHLAAGRTIIGLEPSCTVMLRDEATELLPDDPRAQRLAAQVRTFAEFVAAHDGPWPFDRLNMRAVSQVHCHQEAKGSYDADCEVLERVGVDTDVVSAGCCGLAGNFGFERGHWEVSQACAEQELFPKIRTAGADDLVLADGFSCRTQIAQGTDREGTHLAKVLHQALRKS
ncbi:FAD-binding and (Fe-S)-binding domain-containing protein [Saccharopolyspora hattusasensis]|uniref:FAD-binding and (Fe-S)-binding domain-containing protein n=1 Tax=Saccharopolyspora hattusasensis TaxID=1128679 RepID=UPI003D966D4A